MSRELFKATVRELAGMLYREERNGYPDSVVFSPIFNFEDITTKCIEDGTINNRLIVHEILDDEALNWFGLTLKEMFDGYCLIAGTYGGGGWHILDVSASDELNSFPLFGEIEKAVAALFSRLDVSEVCVQEKPPEFAYQNGQPVKCRRCKTPVIKSEEPGENEYIYTCLECVEDLYTPEVIISEDSPFGVEEDCK